MTKTEHYQQILSTLDDWDSFLLQESGLPGPRGNLELAQVVADEGNEALFRRYLGYSPDLAPTNSPQEFLAFCGVVGLGRLLAEGNKELLPLIRHYASDPRWRTREGVAMALQRWGEQDMAALIREMQVWSEGNRLEQRAAAAALCEPKLLKDPQQVKEVLQILDQITASLLNDDDSASHPVGDRKSEAFTALRKGLGYCWSVAVAAYPEAGKSWLEKWFVCDDKDVRWIIKENLKKNRLVRMDPAWVDKWRAELDK